MEHLLIKPKAPVTIVEGDERHPAVSYLVEAALFLGMPFAISIQSLAASVIMPGDDEEPKHVRVFESYVDETMATMLVTLARELQAHATKVAEATNQKAQEKTEKTTPIEAPDDGIKIGIRNKNVLIVFGQATKVIEFDANDATDFAQSILKAAKHARTM